MTKELQKIIQLPNEHINVSIIYIIIQKQCLVSSNSMKSFQRCAEDIGLLADCWKYMGRVGLRLVYELPTGKLRWHSISVQIRIIRGGSFSAFPSSGLPLCSTRRSQFMYVFVFSQLFVCMYLCQRSNVWSKFCI